MSFYSNIAQTALRQIRSKGRDITYRAFSVGKFDPINDTVIGESTTDTVIKAVVTDIRIDKIDNSAVQRGDKIVLVSSLSITPNESDKIIDGSSTYQFVGVEEIKTGDTSIIYKLQVRK